jgi:dienelactone hydrolase/Tol biopolymer transport system component
MSAFPSYDSFKALAEQYFSRSSFSEPVFIGEDQIAFLDDRSGTKQISVVTVSTGDIQSVTSYTQRLLSLKCSSESGRILFGMDQDGDECQQLWAINALGDAPQRLTHADSSIHEPGTLTKGGDVVLYRSNARDESTFDIVAISLDGRESKTWLENGGQVIPVDMHHDGDCALAIRSNGNMDADLLLVTDSGEVTNLTPHIDEQWIYGAAFDMDGTGVWMLSNLDREFVALMHQDIESGERRIAYQEDWDVEFFELSPDGQHIVLSVNDGGVSKPVVFSTSGEQKQTRIDAPQGVIDQFSWSPDSSQIAFGISTVDHPSMLMISDINGSTKVIAGETGNEPVKTFTPEAITYATWDERKIPGYFFRPEGDGPFPVLVEIHGGPESQRRLNYTSSGSVLQYLTSLGMAVLSLNVRGSTGYGKEYCHLDDKDKRLDSVKDVEYAARWLHDRDDVMNDKIAVYGVSYGGYMTLASLVFYPDLWAAGVEMVGMANLVSFLERTGPWRRKAREAEYGELENDRELLERISPLNHIENIRVPLMVFHGKHDPRVPLFESEQIAEAVRKRGQEVVLRVYDNEGHSFSKRPNVLDAFALIGTFLTKHLEPVRAD